MVGIVSIGGHRVSDPRIVVAVYEPSSASVSPAEWNAIRTKVRAVVGKAEHGSPRAALFAARYTTQLTAWAIRQDVPLDMGRIMSSDMIDRFVATGLGNLQWSSKSSVRSHLWRVARAQSSAESPPVKYPRLSTLSAPYSGDVIAGFWEAAQAQSNDRRQRVLTTVLVLGAGAGLKASEILSVTAAEHVGRHPGDKRLWVIKLSDRIVPVRVAFVEALKDLCSRYPVGPLIGRVSQRVNDPMGAMIKGIELPAHLPPLRCRRLRITWMVSILSDDVRISEFQTLAGTVSAKSLEGLAPYIPVRVNDREYFFKAAGLDAQA